MCLRRIRPSVNSAQDSFQKPDQPAALAAPSSSDEPDSSNWVLVATVLGSSMAFIDGTVVNVALPALQNYFHASGTDVQWVIESFALLLSRADTR